jgi:hypothetical protein
VVRILPWILFVLVIVLWAPGFVYDPLSDEITKASDPVWALSFLPFSLVGLFLAIRVPSNAVGWLFLVGPALAGAGISGGEYGEAVDSTVVQELADGLFLLGLLCLFASIVLFPDGRYPDRRFRWAHLILLLGLLGAGRLLPEESAVIGAIMFANFLLPIVALIVRAVRGDATTRRQIAGPVLVTVVGLVTLAVVSNLVPEDSDPGGWNAVIAVMVLSVGIPVSIAFSITRYRLDEIDRIVSRTVSYALVVGVLGLVFFGVVTALTAWLSAESDLVVAGSTLAVAALFNPVRRRVQAWVDRRFNRSRYDAERVMDGFASSLRDRVDPEGVVDGWVGVVSDTMQPRSVAVWVRSAS